jgi:hypothetical protein
MSYNILADLYADSDFSRQNLFPQCPPFALGNVSLSLHNGKQFFQSGAFLTSVSGIQNGKKIGSGIRDGKNSDPG